MKKLDPKEEEELLSNENCLFHFVIYIGTMQGNKKRITSVTIATDEGEKSKEEIRKQIMEGDSTLIDVKIEVLTITPNKKLVDSCFEMFKLMYTKPPAPSYEAN